MMVKRFVVSLVLFAANVQATTIVVDNTGKTLSYHDGAPDVFSVYNADERKGLDEDDIFIEIIDPLPPYEVRSATIDRPMAVQLGPESKNQDLVVFDRGGRYVLAFPRADSRFIAYNIIQTPTPPNNKTQLDAELTAAKKAETAKQTECEKAATQEAKHITELQQQLAAYEKELEPFKQLSQQSAVDEIKRIQEEVRRATNELRALQDSQNTCTNDLHHLAAVREQAQAALPTNLLRKSGLLINGDNDKTVLYAYQTDAAGNPSLQRLTDYPTVTVNDVLYAQIANVPITKTDPIQLIVTTKEGKDINPTPVRPSFDIATKGAHAAEANLTTDQAYVDEVLPFNRRFSGNDIPQVTLQTRGTTVTEDSVTTTNGTTTTTLKKETKAITLLDAVEYPRVHPLYRYNFTTGAALTFLRDPSFFKLQTQADDAATKDINEARYRIDTDPGSHRVKSILGITVYWVPVDPLQPMSWRDRIPNPTIAFDPADPGNNIFFGLSTEVFRSTQLVVGRHYGKITALRVRNIISEDQDASAPATTSIWSHKNFVALSFNLNFLAQVFKK